MRLLIFLLLLGVSMESALGQFEQYRFRREVVGIDQPGWYRLPLPCEMFGNLRQDLKDLRLMRVGSDTLETPFLLHSEGHEKRWQPVPVRELNTRTGRAPYYYTFRHDPGQTYPNRLRVKVAERNFDAVVRVEGSDNRLIWNPLVGETRILGIVDANVSYAQRQIDLPETEYPYLRVVWEDPELTITGVELGREEIAPGTYLPYPLADWKISNDTDRRRTVIQVDLPQRYPVSRISLFLGGRNAEYVRTIDLRYARQTVEEPDGTRQYLWREWDRQVLNSYQPAVFHLEEAYTDHLELIIYDQDELPLAIESLEVAGLQYEMRAMLSPEYPYEVIYGSQNARASGYARSRAPESIRTATMGPEQLIYPEAEEDSGLGQDVSTTAAEAWDLWGKFLFGFLVGLLVVVLGAWWGKRKSRKKKS